MVTQHFTVNTIQNNTTHNFFLRLYKTQFHIIVDTIIHLLKSLQEFITKRAATKNKEQTFNVNSTQHTAYTNATATTQPVRNTSATVNRVYKIPPRTRPNANAH